MTRLERLLASTLLVLALAVLSMAAVCVAAFAAAPSVSTGRPYPPVTATLRLPLASTEIVGLRRVARHESTSRRRWLSERHHAAEVREADQDRSHARWIAELVAHSHGYGLDWWFTTTPDWWCIRTLEEGDAVAPANEFGWKPYPGGWSAAYQSRLALWDLHHYGWSPWSTAPACGLS